jgi:hypothetical protein
MYISLFRQGQAVRIGLWSKSGVRRQELALSTSYWITVARNWVSSSGKLAVYSNSYSSTMYIYSSALLQYKEPTPLKITTGHIITIRPNTEKAEGFRGQLETEVLTEIYKEVYDTVVIQHLRSKDISVTLKD